MPTSPARSPRPARSLIVGRVLVVALLSLAGLAGVAAVAAPPARADGVDDAFLSAVKSHGINVASPQSAIIAGHKVCDELDEGRQKSDVANDVMSNSNLDGYRAGYFVGASIAAYCPRHHATA